MADTPSDKPLPPTPRTDWVWNNTPNEDLARDLFNLSSQIERELADAENQRNAAVKDAMQLGRELAEMTESREEWKLTAMSLV